MTDYSAMVGSTLNGRYLLLSKIGSGGMAVVFSAYDRATGETVAIKLLNEDPPDRTQSLSELKKQFANEAKIHSLVSHPCIAGFKRAHLDGSPMYFVMEYIDGVTLKEYIRNNRGLTSREILDFSCQILSALSHIHLKNIVHCDIKPQNIIITRSGKAKLTDFGIARIAGRLPDLPKDKAVGTVYYVSPEQAEGKELDHRSDLYSLGIMMYQMATGKLPFVSRDLDKVAQMHSSAPPKRPRQIDPNISKGLEQIILKAIAKKPYLRFESAENMRKYLELLKKDPSAVFRLQNKSAPSYGTYHPKSAISVLTGCIAAFIIVALVAIPTIYSSIFRGADGKAANLSVPDLWGYSSSDIQRRLDDRYYDIDIIYSYNSGHIAGRVIDQYPAPGTKISVESDERYTVTVTVSADVCPLVMIDVTSMTPEEAEKALSRQGYTVVFESLHNDFVSKDLVCGTSPGAGSTVEAGSTVIAYISLGASTRTTFVPSLVGMTDEEAANIVKENGLRIGKVTYKASDKPKGTILSHSACNQTVTVGTAIDFVISGGTDYSSN